MKEFMSLVQNVSDKALFFKDKADSLDARVLELELEMNGLKNQLNEKNEEIRSITIAQETQKTSLESASNPTNDLNDRIDELVREIDGCLLRLKK